MLAAFPYTLIGKMVNMGETGQSIGGARDQSAPTEVTIGHNYERSL